MRLPLRKSLWWMTELTVALVLMAIILPPFIRNAAQRRAAKRIAAWGGSVHVRWEGPAWLLAFASDECRDRFDESAKIAASDQQWLRDTISEYGVDAFVEAWDVADRVELQVASEPGAEDGADPKDVPEILDAVSRLSTIRELAIHCPVDCDLNLRNLPPSLHRLIVHHEGQNPPTLDFGSLPAELKELRIAVFSDGGRAKCSNASPPLPDLEVVELSRLGVDDEFLARLSESTSLRRLIIPYGRITDAGVARNAVDVGVKELTVARHANTVSLTSGS